MRDILAFILFIMIAIGLQSPEAIGAWLKRVDDVRYMETMYE